MESVSLGTDGFCRVDRGEDPFGDRGPRVNWEVWSNQNVESKNALRQRQPMRMCPRLSSEEIPETQHKEVIRCRRPWKLPKRQH